MSEKNRILLVDDDRDLLRLLSMRLAGRGYETVVAESGEEALAQVELARPQAVITDLRMEGMDGMVLADCIHRKNPALPVIILTAHGSIPDAVHATKNGVFAFLTKPFNSRELLAQVEKALQISGTHYASEKEPTESWREEIITRSSLMEDLLSQARLVAESDASICLRGDSGTGKELLAKAIHKASSRNEQPFIAVNCAAIPELLLESELFGHAKGAFTGATRDYPGLFQAAHGGTLFLDEIGDMPFSLQVKLLRALQEQQVRPVGSTSTVMVDVRIISATHRDLDAEVRDGNFREDLYYRLNVVVLEIPPLAERREDILPLASHFLSTIGNGIKKNVRGFSGEAIELLVSAPWPGNVRQLHNVVEQTVALSTTPIISAKLVKKALRQQSGQFPSFAEARRQFEQEYLAGLLKITNGNVTQAARLAQRNRTDFYKLLQRHNLDPSAFKPVKRQ
ncbi:sigma-54 factor interaction domain-containing protein [Nitrosococcus halophilus Nc 4]|uniref:Sigma-54 factor interaction domain-containing protein n=1 Tax=Nitrosococcus halophilus (strain Nc4) TaxID=472759 RepID=D5C597_NITHN|nr:sigma 54-interacting transcriptional regulator [Nitrosococcus halophilus]ADE15320.1 sigma-54 factor interaction domain-containing protein [Nitrosococcus halophilus Nc 4]